MKVFTFTPARPAGKGPEGSDYCLPLGLKLGILGFVYVNVVFLAQTAAAAYGAEVTLGHASVEPGRIIEGQLSCEYEICFLFTLTRHPI